MFAGGQLCTDGFNLRQHEISDYSGLVGIAREGTTKKLKAKKG